MFQFLAALVVAAILGFTGMSGIADEAFGRVLLFPGNLTKDYPRGLRVAANLIWLVLIGVPSERLLALLHDIGGASP